MRGYRDPSDSEEFHGFAIQFEDQFEHDGAGLTFRNRGRGRPVRVTPEERDAAIASFERKERQILWATIAAGAGCVIGSFWWGEWSNVWLSAGLVAIALANWGARRLAWTRAVSRFVRRAPIGPERTLIDQYRMKAISQSWGSLTALGLACGAGLWLVDPDRLDVINTVELGVALAAALGLTALKLLGKRKAN